IAAVDREIEVPVESRRQDQAAPEAPVQVGGADRGPRPLRGEGPRAEVGDAGPQLPREEPSRLDLEPGHHAPLARVAPRAHDRRLPRAIEVTRRRGGPEVVTPRLRVEDEAGASHDPLRVAERFARLRAREQVAERVGGAMRIEDAVAVAI